jgi:serine/threonine-protein kinase
VAALGTAARSRHHGAVNGGFAVGETIGDCYTIRRVLGQGKMGQILEADDAVLQRRVAIKVPLHAQAAAVLLQEARALAALQHANLPVVHAAGEHAGLPFLVMERLSGTSLEDHLEAAYQKGHPLGLPEAVGILRQVADALDAIHQAGVAHRDIKPENIMLCGKRGPVLIDFGLVVPEYNQTDQRMYGGSPHYVSPEVIKQNEAPGAGALSDLYSLGVTGYQVLTGRTPYDGPSLEALLKLHVDAPVPDARMLRPSLPSALAELIVELMAKRAGERPQSAEDVVWRLRQVAKTLGNGAARSKPTVMVVSDDPTLSGQVDVCMRSWVERVSVSAQRTAELALSAIEADPPAMLLVDLGLNDNGGVELLMNLRGTELARRPAVVAIQSGAQASDLELLRRLEVKCFVAKGDYLPQMLEPVARNVLGKPADAVPSSRF